MARLVVTGGNIAWDGQPGRGGHAMYILQWLEALRRFGHEILYCDCTDGEPAKTALFARLIERWWNPRMAALVLSSGQPVYGRNAAEIERFGHAAAALITLGSPYRREPAPWLAHIRPRVLIETDPGFCHLWASESGAEAIFGEQDFYVRP
jgi:hypothetical protein